MSDLVKDRVPECDCSPNVKEAIARLQSLHDGAGGVIEVVKVGDSAVPALRKLLLRREPSGLHQIRCRAVDALATLKAYTVLGEFLSLERDIPDPVERLGEDTVISAAARALARQHDDLTFSLLVKLARRKPLSGVVAGLGSFKRPEVASLLVDALLEDDVRMTAEASLRSLGTRAKAALMQAVRLDNRTACEDESESQLRKRRSALALICEMRVTKDDWDNLWPLIQHPDHQIAILACGLCGKIGDARERADAATRMKGLRAQCSWLERLQIDQVLQRLAGKRKSR